jgi:maintenance of morphology protein 1
MDNLQLAVKLANREFVKGFVAGQLILLLLLFVLLRVFLFNSIEKPQRFRMKRVEDALELDLNSPQESVEWLNVVLGFYIQRFRRNQHLLDELLNFVDLKLNESRPRYVSKITLTELDIGTRYPRLSNVRVAGCVLQVDFDITDQLKIGVDTLLVVNWPKSDIAELPVTLLLTITKFTGTLYVEFTAESLSVSLMDGFTLEFQSQTLLGSRTKVKDLPKLQSIISTRIQQLLVDHLVYPNNFKLEIPKFNS